MATTRQPLSVGTDALPAEFGWSGVAGTFRERTAAETPTERPQGSTLRFTRPFGAAERRRPPRGPLTRPEGQSRAAPRSRGTSALLRAARSRGTRAA